MITNTSDDFRKELLFGGNPGAIEFQEAIGQEELCNSDCLPVKGSDDEKIQALPIEWGEVVPGDDLFKSVKLPKGWKIKPTDHSMWSDLVDDSGKKQAAIFYKAAFYDRRAHIHVAR